MKYTIDASDEKYIRVTGTGVLDRNSLMSAMSELMRHPEYAQKHSLWDFSGVSFGITLQDLEGIVGFLSLFQPLDKNFANRSALVVPGKMYQAMAEMFVSMTQNLIFEYKVFQDKRDALGFLKSA
jgi:hypothetical protein